MESLISNTEPEALAEDLVQDMETAKESETKSEGKEQDEPPISFDKVLLEELFSINEGRHKIKQPLGVTTDKKEAAIKCAHDSRLMGLAFSGGGDSQCHF